MRSLLHGRQPGRLRPRTHLGRDQDHARQRDHHQAARVRCRVQFSGGEPTLSPYFLDAVAYARKVGYNSVQAATNGIEFAKSKEFAKAAAEAGLRYAYLQFDGIGNAANSHRKVGNAFDVKLQAIHNLHEAGVDIVPVTTIVNGINNEQVGRIIEFALDNPKKINFLSFQPVCFTGRDEEVSDERRAGAALHPLAPRARRQEPDRPRRAHARLVPHLLHVHLLRLGRPRPRTGPRLGPALLRLPPELRHRHGAHDRQGDQGSRSGHRVPQRRPPRQGRRPRQRRRPRQVPLHHRRRRSRCSATTSPTKAPTHFKIIDLLQKFDKCFGATGRNYGKVTGDRTMEDIKKRRADRWNFLFIAGMWFQDLFNYDFRRTEQCIIPYATQEGEICFCAYNTGVGWRNIIEKMHMTSTLTKWYEEHGRHEIFAGGKKVGLEKQEKYDLVLNEEHVNAAANDTFEKSGIAKNAREEKIRARDAKLKQDAENARMAKLYRKEILKEPELPGGFVALGEIGGLGGIKPAAAPAPKVEVVNNIEETVAGD